jgi:ATP-dependent exoDNAse (exonuclease V) beta subunit
LETEEELIILDYKLSNLEKGEYVRQLGMYKDYLESISDKQVSAYLYSLLRGELRRIF